MSDGTQETAPEAVDYGYRTHFLFQGWLSAASRRVGLRSGADGSSQSELQAPLPEPLVFVKSWNDWGNGCGIAPDKRYGYKTLQSLKSALTIAGTVVGPRTQVVDLHDFEAPASEFDGVPRKPIVVLQMGRVGSIAVTWALQELNLPDPIVHSHGLHAVDEQIESALRYLPNPEVALPALMEQKAIRDWMNRADEETVWNVVTIVREPIARNLSCFITNVQVLIPDVAERLAANDVDIRELQDFFLTISYSRKVSAWYQEYFEPTFPFQLASLPYQKDKGYVTAEKHPYRLIVFRTEDLKRVLAEGLSEFLGLQGIQLHDINRTDEQPLGRLYEEFKKLPWPQEYVDDMYDDPIVHVFYSEDELAALRRRYLAGR